MSRLAPLETLYEVERGGDLPLPRELASLDGRLSFLVHSGRPYIIGNFARALDGVVLLNEAGQAGGGDISGFDQHDRMVMGLLRTIADVVIVGAGTLRVEPQHRSTADYIYPPLAQSYQLLRTNLGKSEPPLNVIVTARGEIDLDQPLLRSGEIPVLIVTTEHGLQQLHEKHLPLSVQASAVQKVGSLGAQEILAAAHSNRQSALILVEGGLQLMGDFLAGGSQQ